jgi:hypothetical protein
MYRQSDGYPSGHGVDLAAFLTPITLINGIGLETANVANGMGCLAAQMIVHFKHGVGGIYMQVPDVVANAEGWQEYEYHVYPDHVEVCTNGAQPKILFTGSWQAFAKWCEKPEAEDTDLRTALQAGVVNVTFNKADGSVREMRCTTNVDYLPVDTFGHAPKTGRINPHLFKVWDVEVKGWRSFREERVIRYASE